MRDRFPSEKTEDNLRWLGSGVMIGYLQNRMKLRRPVGMSVRKMILRRYRRRLDRAYDLVLRDVGL